MTTNETLAAKKAKATKLLKDIEYEYESLKSLSSSIIEISKGISKNDSLYKRKINSLNRITTNIQSSVDSFNAEKTKIKSLLSRADRFYNKSYLPLKTRIEDSKTGFKAKINSYNRISKKLDKIEVDCDKKYSEVNSNIIDFRRKIKDLRTLESSIRKLHTTSATNKSESDNRLAEIIKIERESKLSYKNIVKLVGLSTKLNEKIISTDKETKNRLNDINKNLNTSKNTLTKIQEIYDIAAETGRSGEFENRRNKLKIELKKWEISVLVVSIVLLIAVSVLFFVQLYLLDWKLNDLNYNFYLRFILLSPIVYYLIFCVNQYNKTKRMFNMYSFKTTMAMSIRHHIDLLLNQELFIQKGQIEQVVSFVLDAFKKIYNEPYSNNDQKMRLKLANIELDLEKRIIELIKSEKNKHNS